MIKEKILMPGVEYRIKNGADISLQVITDLIAGKAEQYGIAVGFEPEQIAPDAIAGLLGSKKECVILFHPKFKKNYLRYVIQVDHQGTYAFINVNKTNGFAPNSSISAGIEGARTLAPKNETGWYTIVDDIFEELFA